MGEVRRRRPPASERDRALGARIRAARLAAGLRQEDLARAIGVSYQQVWKYETGTNRLPAARLLAIAEAVGEAPGTLLAGDLVPLRGRHDRLVQAIAARLRQVDSLQALQAIGLVVDALAGDGAVREDSHVA